MPTQPEKQRAVETKILALLEELNDEDPLPSAAMLAALCEVTRRLVHRVERRLARKGLIEIIPQRGAYKRKAPPSAFEVAERELRELARPLGPGERLPTSAGALARKLKLSKSAVLDAARTLRETGVLGGRPGANSGLFRGSKPVEPPGERPRPSRPRERESDLEGRRGASGHPSATSNPPESKSALVEATIRDLLKQLDDSDPLPDQIDLAELCEVDEETVRKVQRRLEEQGVVKIVPRRGVFKGAAPPSAVEIAERELRKLAEPLHRGDRLPIKVDALARQLEIAPRTVSRAVGTLKSEGVLYGQLGRNGGLFRGPKPAGSPRDEAANH